MPAMSVAQAKLNTFPVFMKVKDRLVAIVGGGGEALAKARLMAQSSAVLRIVADEPEADLVDWAFANGATLVRDAYSARHIEGAVLVFAATGEEALDAQVVADAHAAGICANAVDRPELCDFFTPAIVNRAPVAVAIGTDGAGPVLAQQIRSKVDRMLSPSLGALASLAEGFRGAVERMVPKGNPRRAYWNSFFEGAPARAMEIGSFEDALLAA